MIVNFQNANRGVLSEMVSSFYDRESVIPDDESLDYKWTPAEVNQILFRNFEDPEKAVNELVTLDPHELYGLAPENGFVLSEEEGSGGK
jgi:hypothetical protein